MKSKEQQINKPSIITQFTQSKWNNINSNPKSKLSNTDRIDLNKKKKYSLQFLKTPSLVTTSRLNESILLGQLKYKERNIVSKKVLLYDVQQLSKQSKLYFDFPIKNNKKLFKECKEDIQKLLKKQQNIYIFTKNCIEINDFNDLPWEDHLVFVSFKPFFNGLSHFKEVKYQEQQSKQELLQLKLINLEQELFRFYNEESTLPSTAKMKQFEIPSTTVSTCQTPSHSRRLQSLQFTLKQIQDVQKNVKNSQHSQEFPYFNNKFFKSKSTQFFQQTQQRPFKMHQHSKFQLTKNEKEFIGKIDNLEPGLLSIDSSNQDLTELDHIIEFYDKLLKQPYRKKEPRNLQDFNGASDLIPDDVHLDRIGERLNEAIKKEFLDEQLKEIYQRNSKLIESSRMMTIKVQKRNKPLFLQSVPSLVNNSGFSRYYLHSIYVLFKVLHIVTAQKYKNKPEYQIQEGIDYETFRNGIYQIFLQSEQLAKGIFSIINKNFSGFIDWPEFLNIMEKIHTKTLEQKIDVFISLADADGNGNLSYEEVHSLCRISLERFVNSQDTYFLESISEFFTRLIFDSVEIEYDQEIPLEMIKQQIMKKNQNSDLLCMFCGADL